MYILIYENADVQNLDVVQDDEGNTVFETYEDCMALKCFMVAEGFDPEDYRICKLSYLD